MSVKTREVYGLILAGGRGKRLGRKKDKLRLKGKPVISHLTKTLTGVTQKIFLSLRRGQKTPIFFRGEIIRDSVADAGPFGAIYTALQKYPGADWMVVACDQVSIKKKMLSRLLVAKQGKTQGVIFKTSTGIEPLCAIYGSELTPLFEKQYLKGEFALHRLLKRAGEKIVYLSIPTVIDNVNSINDLKSNTRLSLGN